MLVLGVLGFEVLPFVTELAGELVCLTGAFVVAFGAGVGGLLPGIGFSVGGGAKVVTDVGGAAA
jgi:hypothetical protein